MPAWGYLDPWLGRDRGLEAKYGGRFSREDGEKARIPDSG